MVCSRTIVKNILGDKPKKDVYGKNKKKGCKSKY